MDGEAQKAEFEVGALETMAFVGGSGEDGLTNGVDSTSLV